MNIVTKNEINILIQLAKSDNHFASEERDMIFRVGHQHNCTDEEINKLIIKAETVDTLGALSPQQKLNYLLHCVELIHADSKVVESELMFCKGVAMKMGLRRNVIDFLIENWQTLDKSQLQKSIFDRFTA